MSRRLCSILPSNSTAATTSDNKQTLNTQQPESSEDEHDIEQGKPGEQEHPHGSGCEPNHSEPRSRTSYPYTPYWVLYTDYVNLAVVYSCTDVLRLFHVDFAWILGRARALSVVTTNSAKMVFSNNNIDVSKMISTDQQGCDKRGKVRSIEGTAVVQDIRQPAKLGVSFSYFTPYTPYWVLYTDYVNLAVVYSCTDVLRLFHVDFAWILGRARALSVVTTNSAKMVFSNNNIDVSKMISTDQQGCDK
ncbi:hypothetical protein COCON_G00063320 [Conger conger]|uniref:Apolipoprotein D n=1 Tax=Conger conger TaxID=82655 RepID=A0A9Q1DRY5_CONCO|nr:hypothetical protein COCON_G00063320 [Conger conger]